MENLIDKLLFEHGLSGVMLAVFIYLFIKSGKAHREERDEWRKSYERTTDRHIEAQDKTTVVIRELATTIKEANELNRKDR